MSAGGLLVAEHCEQHLARASAPLPHQGRPSIVFFLSRSMVLSSSLKQSLKNPRQFGLLGTELAVYCIGAYGTPLHEALPFNAFGTCCVTEHKGASLYVWSNSLNMCRSGTCWWRVWVWRTVGFTSARSPPTRHSPSLCVYMCQVSSPLYLLNRHIPLLCVYMCQVSSPIFLLTRHRPSLCPYMCQVSSAIYSCLPATVHHCVSTCARSVQQYTCLPTTVHYCASTCARSVQWNTCLPATVLHCVSTCARSVHWYTC